MTPLRFHVPKVVLVVCVAMLGVLACAPAASANGLAFRGVSVHSLWNDADSPTIHRELDLAAASGSNVVRVDVSWSRLEQAGEAQRSALYAGRLDEFMRAASARGLRVIAMLWSTPCWASSAPPDVKQGCRGDWWQRDVQYYPPADPRHYASVARWLTGRYGPALAALEVWNEPNLPAHWGGPAPAAKYARLLKVTYPEAKAGNAKVPVLAASLSGADRAFLEKLYAHRIRGHYDGIAIHPYNEWRAPEDPWQPQFREYAFLPGIRSIREAQARARDSKTPLWLTEFGWSTGAGAYSYDGQPITVSEPAQADYIARAFRLMCHMDFVRAGVVYGLRDQGTNTHSYLDNFGIVRRNYSWKPAFDALRLAAWEGCRGSGADPGTPDTGRPKLRLTKAPQRARRGKRVRVTGELRRGEAPAGRPVEIEYRYRRRWRHAKRTSLKPNGSFSTRVTLRAHRGASRARLRARMPRLDRSNQVAIRLLPPGSA